MSNNVLLIDHENDHEADFRLHRLLEWGGHTPSSFSRVRLYGESANWDMVLSHSPSVMVPMGPLATRLICGPSSFAQVRGYIAPVGSIYAIPTVHPYFIQRGQSRWSAAFINDVNKAVQLAQFGHPPVVLDYALDPLPYVALDWARTYTSALAADPTIKLAYDIETPGKGEDEEDLETDSDAPDRTWNIERIGFAYRDHHALSIPWDSTYMAAIRLLMGSMGDKVVWNSGFDTPRIRRAGVSINGTIHDAMVAWHILHSDLPKRLGFVATFTCPLQPAWKHLSGARPAYYNATDADVEWRSMEVIERELRGSGLWDVYQKDVLDLEPILTFMSMKGMPVDAEIRLDRAKKLVEESARVKAQLEALIPLSARKIEKVFVKPPKEDQRDGLLTREGTRLVSRCSVCGALSPRKDHFRKLVKRVNPCAAGEVSKREESALEYYRLAEWSPSGNQLTAYHNHLHRALPMVWNKVARARKVSFGERQILDLMGRYPDDKLYPLILTYRQLQKIGGTYIGVPEETSLPSRT